MAIRIKSTVVEVGELLCKGSLVPFLAFLRTQGWCRTAPRSSNEGEEKRLTSNGLEVYGKWLVEGPLEKSKFISNEADGGRGVEVKWGLNRVSYLPCLRGLLCKKDLSARSVTPNQNLKNRALWV